MFPAMKKTTTNARNPPNCLEKLCEYYEGLTVFAFAIPKQFKGET
jgi:hypothetical protein